MTIIYVSDFDLRGSGYKNIAVELCTQLSNRGYEIIAPGLGYNGQAHYYPFTIVPARMQDIAPMVQQLGGQGVDIEAVIVALDIPLQEKLLDQLGIPGEMPYIGIFPIEAGPLCGPWAMSLLRMNERLIMSRFGQEELKKAGVDSEFIPIGVDLESWRPPEPEEREGIRRGLGIEEDTYVILTVADNQERKNLSRSMEIFAGFAEKKKAVYWMVTRPNSIVGWKLEDYALRLGIMDKMMIWERGISFKELWSLYAGADIMLLTSKAEGLALPVLEAMATRLAVVGTDCAAIKEHLEGNGVGPRGLLIPPDYQMIDPWGNSTRYFAGLEDGIYNLRLWADGMRLEENRAILDRAEEYVRARNWDTAGDILEEAIVTVKGVGSG